MQTWGRGKKIFIFQMSYLNGAKERVSLPMNLRVRLDSRFVIGEGERGGELSETSKKLFALIEFLSLFALFPLFLRQACQFCLWVVWVIPSVILHQKSQRRKPLLHGSQIKQKVLPMQPSLVVFRLALRYLASLFLAKHERALRSFHRAFQSVES